MQFYSSPTSPFARKCLIVAHERGVIGDIERIDVMPQTSEELIPVNPLRRVPALVLDDGTAVIDSRVIVDYLDRLPGIAHLVPADGPARWRALTLQALADGMSDAAVLWRQEIAMRPAHERSPAWIEKQRGVLTRTIGHFSREAERFGATFDIGTIAVAVAIDYALFRFGEEGWLADHPGLAAWFGRFTDRDSFRATKPPP